MLLRQYVITPVTLFHRHIWSLSKLKQKITNMGVSIVALTNNKLSFIQECYVIGINSGAIHGTNYMYRTQVSFKPIMWQALKCKKENKTNLS